MHSYLGKFTNNTQQSQLVTVGAYTDITAREKFPLIQNKFYFVKNLYSNSFIS